MALIPKLREVPEDAIVINEDEATQYMWDLVSNWDTLWDTWALRYSTAILGGASSLTGIVINSHYRTRLRLGSYGHWSSLLPIVFLPAMFTGLSHRYFITTNMLLMKNQNCPLCYEIKSAIIQCGFGVFYPMLLAPTSAFMYANRYNTYRIPSLHKNPKELFHFWKKFTKPLSGFLVFVTAAHCVLSSLITYFELRNNSVIRRKLIEIEKSLDYNL